MMKDILFDMIDQINLNHDKKASISKKLNKMDSRDDYVIKSKLFALTKSKISFRSSINNSFAYH